MLIQYDVPEWYRRSVIYCTWLAGVSPLDSCFAPDEFPVAAGPRLFLARRYKATMGRVVMSEDQRDETHIARTARERCLVPQGYERQLTLQRWSQSSVAVAD
jgi:hypothetical protein